MMQRTRKTSSESGISLILALLTLLLISAIAAGLVMLSNTETSISSNFRDEQRAFFSARGGIEEVRDRMRQNAIPAAINLWGPAVPNISALALPIGGANSVIYVTNPAPGDNVQPWTAGNAFQDTEICQEVTPPAACTSNLPTGGGWWVSTAAAPAPYAATPPLVWKWTRITLKSNGSTAPNYTNGSNAPASLSYPVCWTGSNEVAVNAASCAANVPPYLPVFTLTSYAVTPSGSHRMVQSEVALVTFPPLPGALTFAGPGATFNSPNSNPFKIKGQDSAVPACPPAGNKPAIATYNSTDASNIQGGLAKPNNYSGYPPGSPTSVSPSVSNTGPTAPPPGNTMGVLGTVSGLNSLVNTVSSIADQTVPSGGTPPMGWGTAAQPLVTVATGNLTFGPGTGYGILLVEGNLTLGGNFAWNGVIMVIGTGNVIQANGGGNAQITGGILVANTTSGVVGNTPGPPNFNWNGGGGNGIQYNSCDVNSLFNNRTSYFRMVATRELMH